MCFLHACCTDPGRQMAASACQLSSSRHRTDTLACKPVQELASEKDQPALRTHRRRFEPQLDFVPVPALAAAFEKSSVFAVTRQRLDTPYDKSKSHPAALMKSKCAATWSPLLVCGLGTAAFAAVFRPDQAAHRACLPGRL